jgi:NAD(P)-dependent dehydrogenase (short-subunit alcohol dehydrogenase family)/acyl carrier protein
LAEWESDQYPLRACVSSFGIGGTNAHVVLEEWPNHHVTPGNSEYQLIVLTAKTQTALDKMKQNLARYLSENPGLNLGDVAYTLQVGRKVFKHRWMAVCSTRDEAIEALTLPGGTETQAVSSAEEISLPGETAQTANPNRHLLTRTGRLWLQGEDLDWNRLYSREKQGKRFRVSLPTYPFERQRYWLKGDVSKYEAKILPGNLPLKKDQDITDWFYLPSWKRSVPDPRKKRKPPQKCKWLVFVNELTLGKYLVNKLIDTQPEVVVVKMGAAFGRLVDKDCQYTYGINPKESSHYESLFKELEVANLVPDRIIHCWNVTWENDTHLDIESFDETQYYGFFSLLDLTKAIGKQDFSHDIKITVLTNHLVEVIGGEPLRPEKSTLLGLLKSIPQEYPGIRCSCFDILLPESGSSRESTLIDTLLTELTCDSTDTLIAFRNNQRWVETFEPLPLEKPGETLTILRNQGVYLVAGGLGNIGLIFSELLVRHAHARLVLIGRSAFPSRDEWGEWLNKHDESDPVSVKIKKLQKLEEMGGQVLYIRVDISDLEQMRHMISYVEKTFGNINGVIHSAGIMEGSSLQSVQQLSHEQCKMQFNAKVYGLLVLEELFRDNKPDFFWILSSISSVLGGLGLGAYASANLFMDAFIKKHTQKDGSHPRWFGLNWDGIDPQNTSSAFERAFSLENIDQLLFSNGGCLQDRINRWIKLEPLKEMQPSTAQTMSNLYPRPDLPTTYVAPRNSNEKAIIKIWQELLGYIEIGANDDFLQLGGDSLKAITAISRIYQQLNINIPVTEFFNKPTAAGIADYISSKAQKGTFASIASVEKKEFYPVSSAQKRLYVLQQLHVKSTRYNLPMAFRLEGALEIDRVADTFNRLIQRHESFRTSFEMREYEPIQMIHDTVDFISEYYNSNNGAGEDIPKMVKQFIRYFDLACAPLFRAGMIKLSENSYILMVDMHHIVSDGTSLGNAITEFMAFYAGNKLPELRIQYKDFSRWQRQEFESRNIKKQGEYWLNRFKGNIPSLDMPLDYPRPPFYSAKGKRISFQVDREITVGLKQLILEMQTTLYIVLLAAFNILLLKYSGQEDIVVGTPIAGRRHADLENVMGVFANMLAMRNQPQKEKSLKEFLKEVKINALNAYENQDYQFEELIWNLKIKTVGGRNPLFDAVFVLQNTVSEEMKVDEFDELKKIKVFPYETQIEKVHHELLLCVSEGEDVLFMCVEFSTELYREETARKISKNFIEILQQIIENQDIPLKNIKISHDLIAAKPDVIQDQQSDFRF